MNAQDATQPGEDLVVDSRYAELVFARLARLGIGFADQEPDSTLNLTLLTGLVDRLDEPIRDLDPLLAELRRGFAADCGGWTPDLAKNRPTDLVFGLPSPRIHGLVPKPVHEDLLPQAATTGGAGVTVGIVDTVLFRHPSLSAVEADEEFAATDTDGKALPMRAGHSAFVASVVARHAPESRIRLHAALDRTGRGTLWTAARKIAAFGADEHPVQVLNLSLGTRTADGLPPLLMSRAIAALHPDTIVVASAGNHGDSLGLVRLTTSRAATWPAALSNVIAVGAHKDDGSPAVFSPQLPWVDVTAPGVDVIGAYLSGPIEEAPEGEPFTGLASWSGTSFAAARVTGEIAARIASTSLEQVLAELHDSGVVRKYDWEDPRA